MGRRLIRQLAEIRGGPLSVRHALKQQRHAGFSQNLAQQLARRQAILERREPAESVERSQNRLVARPEVAPPRPGLEHECTAERMVPGELDVRDPEVAAAERGDDPPARSTAETSP